MNKRSILAFAGFAALVAAAGLCQHAAGERRARFPAVDDLVYLPSPGALRVASLGHGELGADLVFLRTIVYFSGSFVGSRDFGWLPGHLDTAIALDPDFRAPYLFGSRATMYNGNPITNESVRLSSHFLEEGLRRFPNDWEMAFALGCNYIFELKSDDPKQREAWRREGGRWIRRAAIAGGGPPWLAGLAARIMSEEGQVEASLRYLEEAYLTAPDERARDEIGRLLQAKRREGFAKLQAAGEAFARAHRRTLPYAPADLFVAVGEPPAPRMDLAWLARDEVLDAEAREAALADERDRQ